MSEFPWSEAGLVVLIFIVSGIAQGILGFAFGIVAMTMLPAVLGFRDAVTLLALLNAAMMILATYWQKSAFRWSEARKLIIGALIGIPIGALMVGTLPEQLLYIILGVTMLAISLSHFIRRKHAAGSPPATHWEIPVGIASGILSSGFNMGGPPLVGYVYARNWPLQQIKAVLASCFLVSGVTRLLFIGVTAGALNKTLLLAGLSLIPAGAALRLGISLGHRAPQQWLRQGVFIYLGLTGVFYLLHR